MLPYHTVNRNGVWYGNGATTNNPCCAHIDCLPPTLHHTLIRLPATMMDVDTPPANTANNRVNNNETMISTGAPSQIIQSLHQDYIHAVKFDVYGRRIATCSGDRLVRIWELQETGEWILTSSWQAHKASVADLDWAHPEFGSILATAGSDNAKIWEEQTQSSASAAANTTTPTINASPSNNTTPSRWVMRASLTEARRGVTCVEFAPRYWGLKLAVGSADGCVRIYEAIDIMNLSQWPLAATLQAFADTSSNQGCTTLSWSTGRFEPPTLIAGGTHLVIYRYSKSPSTGTQAWYPLLKLPSPDKGDIFSVAWAPNVGRRFHVIASAEDDQLKIYTLSREFSPPSSTSGSGGGNSSTTTAAAANTKAPTILKTQTIATPAWRVQWNVTGTVVAVSAEQSVQLYKANATGDWEMVSQVQGDAEAEAMEGL